MPVLSKDFFAVRPGNVYPEVIPAGSEIDGELADIAASIGILEESAKEPKSAPETAAVEPDTAPVAAAPKTRAKRKAPETK